MTDLRIDGLTGVPLADATLARKDFLSNQEVRWCAGCGDYSILAAFSAMMPELGITRENAVVVSGIGCSSRFPYYVNLYGLHSIHGRATAIASGLATSRDDLAVFVMTGDGDALSIGGNHLIHLLRRNINLTVIMFNNRIYGLTKGQYSPTSEVGKITSSTPFGVVDTPFNPVSLALGAEASFVARTIDSDREHLTATLTAAARHRGASFVEVYQNCPIFNPGSFDSLKGEGSADEIIKLVDGEPLVSAGGRRGVVRNAAGSLEVVEVTDIDPATLVRHDASNPDPSAAFAVSRLSHGLGGITPVGIFRSVDRPTYDDEVRAQIALAGGDKPTTDEGVQALLEGKDSWLVH